MRYINTDSTGVSIQVFLMDKTQTDGAGVTGLLYNSSGLLARYYRTDTGPISFALASQTPTGVFVEGGFAEVSATGMPGLYRLDIPNAAIAAGADSSVVYLHNHENIAPTPIALELRSIPAEVSNLGDITNNIFDGIIDNSLTLKQFLRAVGSLAAGETSGGGTASVVFKALNDGATTRITATVDSSGNRSSVVLNL